jgi:hypothetical protein
VHTFAAKVAFKSRAFPTFTSYTTIGTSAGRQLRKRPPGTARAHKNEEHRIKSLLNADLKEICKAYGAAVSGTKVILQKRCIQGECNNMSLYGSGAERDCGEAQWLEGRK